jgi:hypothetical protein
MVTRRWVSYNSIPVYYHLAIPNETPAPEAPRSNLTFTFSAVVFNSDRSLIPPSWLRVWLSSATNAGMVDPLMICIPAALVTAIRETRKMRENTISAMIKISQGHRTCTIVFGPMTVPVTLSIPSKPSNILGTLVSTIRSHNNTGQQAIDNSKAEI